MVSDPSNPNSISGRSRAHRFHCFLERAAALHFKAASLLDIGGTVRYWTDRAALIPTGMFRSIDVANLDISEMTSMENGMTIRAYRGDARIRTSFRQARYDVVFSNAVLEHVGNLGAQKEMADAIRAAGRYYFVQTPAKRFPLEPHFYVPFFPYLPLRLQTALHRNFDLGFMKKNPDWLGARIDCENTRLLGYAELASLFDDGEIIKERLFGLCKSYIVTNMSLPR